MDMCQGTEQNKYFQLTDKIDILMIKAYSNEKEKKIK